MGFCDAGREISVRPILVGPIIVPPNHLQRFSRHYHRYRSISIPLNASLA